MKNPATTALLACFLFNGCVLTPEPETAPERDPNADLEVPPAQIPGVGDCRIWIPGRAVGAQSPHRSCEGIEASAPAGSWILSRPPENRRLVRVAYVHRSRAGEVVRRALYEASTGRFLREETPRRREPMASRYK
jgi:hypothetical protein